jgi:GNAT superfamily N-acetyltransferase
MPMVWSIMQAAFEEYRDVLFPPSGALTETLDQAMVSLERGGAILAFLDGVPVGSARYERRENHIYSSRIGVLPAHRGIGIAGAMLETIDEVARRQGFSEVRLSTREVM